jgi:hypothetical protein
MKWRHCRLCWGNSTCHLINDSIQLMPFWSWRCRQWFARIAECWADKKVSIVFPAELITQSLCPIVVQFIMKCMQTIQKNMNALCDWPCSHGHIIKHPDIHSQNCLFPSLMIEKRAWVVWWNKLSTTIEWQDCFSTDCMESLLRKNYKNSFNLLRIRFGLLHRDFQSEPCEFIQFFDQEYTGDRHPWSSQGTAAWSAIVINCSSANELLIMQLLSQASSGVERYLYNRHPHHPGESPPIVAFFGGNHVSEPPFQILSHPQNSLVKCCVFNLSRLRDLSWKQHRHRWVELVPNPHRSCSENYRGDQ